MVQMIFRVNEIPDDVKKKIEEDWENGVISSLMKYLKKNLRLINKEKFEKLLSGKHAILSSEDTNDQKPEAYTKEKIINPILRYLGYNPEGEAIKKKPRIIGKKRGRNTRNYPDYRAKDDYDNIILIEAEPLHVDIREKNKGIHQVADWMDFRTRVGFATNGFKWLLIYYHNAVEIEEIGEVDLTSFFQKIWNPHSFVDDSKIKELLGELYFYFSKRWIKTAIEWKIKAITLKKEELTKRFYNDFISIAFGFVEKNGQPQKIKNGIIDYVKAPPNVSEEEKRKFVVLFMNRLIFIVFLEDLGLVPPYILSELYKKWQIYKPPRSFYEEYLVPLFYRVLNTEPDERDEYIK